ncbi:polyamine aminopropyltransferase [Bacillus thuringiensis]|uniref:polyamine aminopropyltransferase n=1 Tax=Bacillus thuringiensis TaxID=1428 RepID=UPI000A3B00EA|nr:polyamine aminopropyltransferase [Bacillus thuringiensis]MED2126961.1 polyamine aminopropyltransferase [Bacillus thuringiensis]MED2148638.1 polyamine aminopropyltransferase [Bacillus thuringiensis]MED2171922.1 polyamine aminopropyltransferase [Bacillus thuringiensis]MED2477284.1 polyamine aminopropyltransferase [Bacillus thuringiensis]MED2574768.1 polyamine aminopropyltransferase [Bacillus thuringiensis]
MPKHRKQSKIKIYRIKSYKKDKRSEVDSDKFELEQQDKHDTQDKQDEQDKQVQSENVIIVPTASHNLDVWDEISLKEIQAGEHTNLFKEKSNYQNINLVQVNDIRLYLDKQLQFSSVDEQIYHEALVHPIMSKVIDPKRVLILGGGDGLALREVLKYETVLHVDLVDLDGSMIDMARNVPELVSLNKSAFFDNRVNTHVCDAKEFLSSPSSLYDVIIIDFPDPATELLSTLYTSELFARIATFLTEDGAFVCQSNSPADAPLVYWSIGNTIEHAGLTVKSYHTIVPSFGTDWGFHIAANSAYVLDQIEQLYVVPTPRTLPALLFPLFQFKEEHLEQRNLALLNSESNLILHQCYKQEMKF